MPAINAAGLYGFTRGMADAEKLGREAEGFQADQAIRSERLKQEQEQGPLRTQALKLGIDEAGDRMASNRRMAPIQEEAAQLNVDIARMTADERKKLETDTAAARKARDAVMGGLREFSMSGNPQAVVDALITTNPKFEGSKATRNEDGTITLTGPENKPITFKAQKWPDGSEMAPDDAMKIFAQKHLDPLKWVENEYQQKFGIAKEQTKQQAMEARQVKVEGIKATGRAAESETKRSAAWFDREHGRADRAVDSILKTKDMPGGFIQGYAHDNDAALVGIIKDRVSDEIENGVPAAKAALAVVDETRQAFDLAQGEANKAAKALAGKNINPRDPAALAAAVKAGNPDALRLQQVLAAVHKRMGPSVAKYVSSNVSAK